MFILIPLKPPATQAGMESGTLFEGIARWAERKAELTHEDVKTRAWQTLKS